MQVFVKRGEVYDIDFGMTVGSVQSGRRPGVVIQNDVGNKFSPNTIVAPITSQIKPNLPTHVSISSGNAGLKKDSIVLLEQPITISKECLKNKMGAVSTETMERIDRAIDISLGRYVKNNGSLNANRVPCMG